MSKPQRRPTLPPASMQTLPFRAAEALEQGRFREAIDLYKQLVRQEQRPDWKAALDDAYRGRARALAAKEMFKEAAMVLENTRAPDGTLRDPLLYATCLIREGQQPKAAAHLLHAVCGGTLSAEERPGLEALLAALLTSAAPPPAAVTAESPERTRWREGGTAAREALSAWVEGAPAEQMDKLLGRISLRSAFRPLRLLLKTLVAGPEAAEKNRAFLETIGTDSPFFPFRQAVEAALGAGLAAEGWSGLSAARQRFVAETAGVPAPVADAMGRLSEAAAAGPAALFAALLKRASDKQNGLDPADLRAACLNLLPSIPDRMGQFEKQFGPLSPLERARTGALAAEAAENWRAAETAWRRVAELLGKSGGQTADLSRAVIFRHLAALAAKGADLEADDEDDDPVSYYLARADVADPDHIPTLLARLTRLRATSCDQEWHRLTEEAAQRFPRDAQVLLQATDSAVARQAYKKAAGFARRLLEIDPINPGLRRQMVEFQIAQARKQIRAKRLDLAERALEEATQWERPEAPNALLRMFFGLLALQKGETDSGRTRLREGVELADGGAGGWFRVVLEAMLMKIDGSDAKWLREELTQARRAPHTKEAILAIVAALGIPEAIDGKRAVSGLLGGMHTWLIGASRLPWSLTEFQTIEETMLRYEQFSVLEAIAQAGRQREPGNRQWRFHEILARSHDNPGRMTVKEQDDLDDILAAEETRADARAMARIRRYLRANESLYDDGEPDFDDMPEDLDIADLDAILESPKGAMPTDIQEVVRELVGMLGKARAAETLMQMLGNSPDGPSLPRPVLRKLVDRLVDMAMKGGKPVSVGHGRGGRRR